MITWLLRSSTTQRNSTIPGCSRPCRLRPSWRPPTHGCRQRFGSGSSRSNRRAAAPWRRAPRNAEASACFVCSEGLANVAKYGSASEVVVTVTSNDGWLTVLIEDDGVGGADLAKGTGIRGLADRVETLGGTLRIDSPSGGGTRLAA